MPARKRPFHRGFGVALALVSGLAVPGCARRGPRRAGGADAAAVLPAPAADAGGVPVALTVVSYNMLWKRAGSTASMAALRAAGADIAVLQEMTPAWERALRAGLGDLYPHMRFNAARAGGVAVLSRWPLDEPRLLPAPRWFPALRVLARTPDGPVQVVALHLRPPRLDRTRPLQVLAEIAAARRAEVEAYWKALDPALPTLIAGDFNETAGDSAVRFLGAQGLTSALTDPAVATWRGDGSQPGLGVQFDHVLFDRHFAAVSARVIDGGDSDHVPLVAALARVAAQP